MARKSKEIQGERIMKYYIIVGWDKNTKQMEYFHIGDDSYYTGWTKNVEYAEIFNDNFDFSRFNDDIYDNDHERIFKMQVNFGRVEEIKR